MKQVGSNDLAEEKQLPFVDLKIERIPSPRMFEEVAKQLRGQIQAGRLRPGDRLPPERELAARFGVSRNTVREALRALELAELIELRQGATGGAFVRPGSPTAMINSMRDLYFLGAVSPADLTKARIAIGTSVARLACEEATDDDLLRLKANVDAAELTAPGDFESRTALHQSFHNLLAEATHNPIMIAMMLGIMEVTKQFILTIGPVVETPHTLPSRRRLLKHLRERNADKAATEMSDFLTRLHDSYMSRAEAHANSAAEAHRS